MRVYFDNAATTPLHPDVKAVMKTAIDEYFGNPSSIHREGVRVRAAVEEARKTIANYLNASIGEVFFTSGGTEANNTALKRAVQDLGVRRIITSKIEHHCVLHSAEALVRDAGVALVLLQTDERGRIDYAALENLLADSPAKTLVSLMHANNELGTLTDIQQVSEICGRHGALFHTDTVQAIGQLPIDVQSISIDFLSGSAHKFHGPKGVGFLYINGRNSIKPFMDGGSQERNMRGGTENIYGILGMAKAMQLACEGMDAHQAHIRAVRSYFMEQISQNFGKVTFNGDFDGAFLPKILSVAFPPSAKNEVLMFSLDVLGISASGGSACSSGVEARSHVLEAIGFEEDKVAVRFSFSIFNTFEEVDFVMQQLKKIGF